MIGAELLFGKNSIPKQKQVSEEIAKYQSQIDSIESVIEQYKIEIERLKNDSLYKEKILRVKYGMNRKEEKIFQFVE